MIWRFINFQILHFFGPLLDPDFKKISVIFGLFLGVKKFRRFFGKNGPFLTILPFYRGRFFDFFAFFKKNHLDFYKRFFKIFWEKRFYPLKRASVFLSLSPYHSFWVYQGENFGTKKFSLLFFRYVLRVHFLEKNFFSQKKLCI